MSAETAEALTVQPGSWWALPGRDHPKKILRWFWDRKEFPSTFLFHGPPGSGKRELARQFALQLLCDYQNACGTCPSCQKFIHNRHPDYLFFPPGQAVKIGKEHNPEEGTIRMLLQRYIPYRPSEGEFRVVVFEEAEQIGFQAESALLKTLEEGPSHTVFILIANHPEYLKDTIRSRAVQIPFRNFSHKELNEVSPPTGEDKNFLEEFLGKFTLPLEKSEEVLAYLFQNPEILGLRRRLEVIGLVQFVLQGLSNPFVMMELEQALLKWERSGKPDERFIRSAEKEAWSFQKDFSLILALAIFCLRHSPRAASLRGRDEILTSLRDFYGAIQDPLAGSFPYALNQLMLELAIHQDLV